MNPTRQAAGLSRLQSVLKFFPVFLVGLLLSTLISGCSQAEKPASSPIPVGVRAAEAFQGGGEVRYSANIQAYANVELAFKVGGYLVGILQVRGVDGKMRPGSRSDKRSL